MLDRPQDGCEEIANSLVHAGALFAACLAVPKLLSSAQPDDPSAYGGLLVFVATMALLYGASILYHALPAGRAKQWFLKLDHAAIYLFIAGSYTPFALSSPGTATDGMGLLLVWLAALAGFTLKVQARLANPMLSTALYVAMGWTVLLAALPLMAQVPVISAAWLVVGGAAYTMGVVFFALDATVRYAHAVWHGFVAAGTGCHVIAVLGLSQPLGT